MKTTTQAWAWLTAGVMALGLNGIYQDGGAAWAHRIANRVANRTESVLALATGRADRGMEKAEVLVVKQQAQSCRLAAAMARMQGKMARHQIVQNQIARARNQARFDHFQAMTDREHAALADFEANRAKFENQVAQVRVISSSFTVPEIKISNLPVVCPRVSVPQVRVPAVHVRTGSGPV